MFYWNPYYNFQWICASTPTLFPSCHLQCNKDVHCGSCTGDIEIFIASHTAVISKGWNSMLTIIHFSDIDRRSTGKIPSNHSSDRKFFTRCVGKPRPGAIFVNGEKLNHIICGHSNQSSPFKICPEFPGVIDESTEDGRGTPLSSWLKYNVSPTKYMHALQSCFFTPDPFDAHKIWYRKCFNHVARWWFQIHAATKSHLTWKIGWIHVYIPTRVHTHTSPLALRVAILSENHFITAVWYASVL